MPAWLEPYLSASNPYFYPAVFVSLLLSGLGVPISADLVLLSIGYVAYLGQAPYAVLIPLSILAIMICDTLMFHIGRNFGTRLVAYWPFRKVLTPERIARAEGSFQANGYRMVFAARFMPGIRTVFMFTSGLLGLRYWKFIAHDFAGALIVMPVTIYSVRWVAGNQAAVLAALKRSQGAVFLGVAAIAFVVWRYRRSRAGAAAAKASAGIGSDPASPRR